jgi:signal transduction histidine kinase
LLVAGALLLSFNLARLNEARQRTFATIEALEIGRRVEFAVINAEAGQRGFLLTGEERYLAPYEAAAGQVLHDIADLARRSRDPEQRGRLDRARPLIEAQLAELAHTIALHRRSPEAALAAVRTDEEQRLSELVRVEIGAFVARTRQMLDERWAISTRRAHSATWLAIGCGALAMVSAGLSVLGVLRRRDERRLHEQNERLEREVAARTARLEAANDELEAYAATISHDLRTPVRAIGGFAQALEEDAGERLDAEQRDWLGRIGAAAERLEGLIDDILRYSRLAHQRMQPRPVELDDVVDAVLDLHGGEIGLAGGHVTVARPLPVAMSDPQALTLAVENLVSNALKFTRPGVAAELRIHGERRSQRTVRLWVEDRGIGIAPADRERIFRPFERLHGREAYAGTGVGLAIVRRVAERSGGGCGVEPAEGGGSRFWIDLPEATRATDAATGRAAG